VSQLKKLLDEDFRSLDDFKAKASQFKPHNTTAHIDKPHKPGGHHKPGKQHAGGKGGAPNGLSASAKPAGAKQSALPHAATDGAAANGTPTAAEAVAAASS
jgi:hypothetical protein